MVLSTSARLQNDIRLFDDSCESYVIFTVGRSTSVDERIAVDKRVCFQNHVCVNSVQFSRDNGYRNSVMFSIEMCSNVFKVCVIEKR